MEGVGDGATRAKEEVSLMHLACERENCYFSASWVPLDEVHEKVAKFSGAPEWLLDVQRESYRALGKELIQIWWLRQGAGRRAEEKVSKAEHREADSKA